jgi:SAM-dependent methyltransferase
MIKTILRRVKRRILFELVKFRYWFAVHYSGVVSFHFGCNVCGTHCRVPLAVMSRETMSCYGCGSTIRYRSVINALLAGLKVSLRPLPSLPIRKDIAGIGLTDSGVYAKRLQQKFSYQNTYYHQEPRLDILTMEGYAEACADFIICSDVLEHVRPPVRLAFENLFRLLKRGGVLILTVPLVEEAQAREHFPNLNEYHFELREEQPVLINKPASGSDEEFHELVFHGGEGETLEMRRFSKEWVLAELSRAGFAEIRVMDEEYPDFGILWPEDKSVPIMAWKNKRLP